MSILEVSPSGRAVVHAVHRTARPRPATGDGAGGGARRHPRGRDPGGLAARRDGLVLRAGAGGRAGAGAAGGAAAGLLDLLAAAHLRPGEPHALSRRGAGRGGQPAHARDRGAALVLWPWARRAGAAGRCGAQPLPRAVGQRAYLGGAPAAGEEHPARRRCRCGAGAARRDRLRPHVLHVPRRAPRGLHACGGQPGRAPASRW